MSHSQSIGLRHGVRHEAGQQGHDGVCGSCEVIQPVERVPQTLQDARHLARQVLYQGQVDRQEAGGRYTTHVIIRVLMGWRKYRVIS